MIFQNDQTGQTMEVTFRKFRYSDAKEIIVCLQDAYGDAYGRAYLYSESEICRLFDQRLFVFTIAESIEIGVIGILGYMESEHFMNSVELVTQVIKKPYKGFHIARAHLEYLLTELQNEKCSALFGHAFCNHVLTQITLTQCGLVPCGFILSRMDREIFPVPSADLRNAKISFAVLIKAHRKTEVGLLYAHPDVRRLLSATYERLNVRAHFADACPCIASSPSVLRFENDSDHKSLEIFVDSAGTDLSNRVEREIDQTRKSPLQTVNVFLNLLDSGAIDGYLQLRKLGFFPTGFQLLSEDAEYLILHHPLQVRLSLDGLSYIDAFEPFVELMKREMNG